MDILQDYQTYLLTAYRFLSPYLIPLISFYRTLQTTLLRVFYPITAPLFDRAAIFAQDQPAVISIVLLGIILVVSIQVLNYTRRIVLWTFGWIITIVFWLSIGLLIYTVVQRGIWKTVLDVKNWGNVLADIWIREYKRWDGVQKQAQTYARAQAEAQGRAPGRGGYGRGNARTGWR